MSCKSSILVMCTNFIKNKIINSISFSMKTKIIFLSVALLMGASAWASVPTFPINGDCFRNGHTYGVENGHAWIELGITRWALCNIGAENPEDYGNYYAWGEIVPKEEYLWTNYKYAKGSSDKLTKYCNNAEYGNHGFTDKKFTLEQEDDIAHISWGGNWRMPTHTEWDYLLYDNCTRTTRNGVEGYEFLGSDGASLIFLPAAGYFDKQGLRSVGKSGAYWSSSLYSDYSFGRPFKAYQTLVSSTGASSFSWDRYCGMSVRPVCSSSDDTSDSDYVTLTLHADSCKGTNTIKCKAGTQVKIEAVNGKSDHNHFVRWIDGNTENPRLVIVKDNVSYTAEFEPNLYTLTVLAGEHGSVSGGGSYTYTFATITATADEHYHFVRWSDGDTYNPRMLKVRCDTTITAEFAIDQHRIDVRGGEHGSAWGWGTFDYGTTITLTAIADLHFHFTQWSDGNTDNPREVVVECDTTYIAEFAVDKHTITTNATNGIVEGGGVYDYGTTITLTAIADEHYHFTQWWNGSIKNPCTVTVKNDATYTAYFAPNKYSITAICDPQQGSVTGAGTYDYSTQVALIATANEGYEFSQWSNGVTDNPYILTVTEDFAIEAQFIPTTAVEDISTNGTSIPQKVFRDGQVYILRNGKTYTTMGMEVE